MGKENEIKQHRIDYKKSISGKKLERILITSKKVKISVQPIIRTNKIRMWLQGEDSEVILKWKKRENELVIMTQEGSDVGNVELKIAIPATINYILIGTSFANVKVRNVLPKELRIKTICGLVNISTLDINSDSEVKINTQYADIRTEIRGRIELESKSTTGTTYNRHETNGKATVKMQVNTISGDIMVL